jgi:hypothetical protein
VCDEGRADLGEPERLETAVTGLPRHLAESDLLTRVAVPFQAAGLVVGRDQQRAPVTVRLFRPEPTRVALVGGWWVARLLVFRVLALGARAVVRTSWPEQWQGLGDSATSRSDRMLLVPADGVVPTLPAGPDEPAVYVNDLGAMVAPQRSGPGAWQTQVTLLAQLVAGGAPVVEDAHVTLLQRLTDAEAAVAAAPLRLGQETAGHLRMMAPDMLAVCGGGQTRYAWVTPTEIEQRLLGAPRRG